MESVITRKGQVVIPAILRKKYKIEAGMRIQWIDNGRTIQLIPIPHDPIAALKGCSEGEKLFDLLIKSRNEDLDRE
ncbi:AbrB/MazE/SpoVT family DNA-binding domain-containing protein [candidate division CSSED10-310 bacterium]|uniref:AbrB/MazE/SpoVT family DNA-binding domain-containing protein n=1 Tax=candidate division CSSED10-310 bacterium TaxID=2855610 RepID=A0ABV6YT51_UNCC1